MNIDSPSGGVEQERVAELIAGWLAPAGCTAAWVDEPDGPARSMVITLAGAGDGVVCLLGHTDTVFPLGTVADRPFRREAMRCYGPGVADMKGGLVLAAMAMESCAAGPRPFAELRLLVCADEEVRLRAPAVCAHATGARAALVFECARENGDLVSSRKGAVWRTIELTGRPAHAGADTARGRSAVSALAGEIIRIEGLAAGPAADDLGGHHRAGRQLREHAPGRRQGDAGHPLQRSRGSRLGPRPARRRRPVRRRRHRDPRPRHLAADAARRRAGRNGAGAGGAAWPDRRRAASGGVSDGCWTGAAGVPTLDGLGPVGALDHTEAEWIELETVERRLELAVRLIGQL